MVTKELEIAEPLVETYEPSVQDKILRIIYRLESGEKLGSSGIYNPKSKKFCVLGLFADESGLGEWVGCSYVINGIDKCRQMILPDEVALYYGLSNLDWDLDTDYLPVDVQNKVKCLNYDWFKDFKSSYSSITSLYHINDLGHYTFYPYINQLLADIIRSSYL